MTTGPGRCGAPTRPRVPSAAHQLNLSVTVQVNEITLREYRDGIYPQDVQLIRHYIHTCQIEKDRVERNLAWSRDMLKKGFRTPFQIKGDELALQQATIALTEAQGMLERLTKFTGPKIIKSLQAYAQLSVPARPAPTPVPDPQSEPEKLP